MEMQNQISSYTSEIRDEWTQYNLKAETLIRNGTPMNHQVIVKDDKPVAVFTKAYKVLPNEEALKVANEVTNRMGLIPASQMSSEWKYNATENFPDVFYGKKNSVVTKISAMYVSPEPVDLGIGSDSDPFLIGAKVGNSIDGSQGFGACVFAFRKICGNMSQHLQSSRMLQLSTAELGKVSNLSTQTITSASFIHRESLKIEIVEKLIEDVIKGADSVVKKFKQMKQDQLTKEQALEVARLYPATVSKNVDWLDYNKKSQQWTPRVNGVTAYDAFNDVTDILSHTTKLGFDSVNYGLQLADKILVRQEIRA